MFKMAKPKTYKRVIQKPVCDCETSRFSKKSRLDNQTKMEKCRSKRGKKRGRNFSCSSYFSCESHQEPVNKRGHLVLVSEVKPKHKCTRNVKTRMSKRQKQKRDLQTTYKNPSYSGSSESVALLTPELAHIDPSLGLRYQESNKSQCTRFPSSSNMDCEHTHKIHEHSGLNGVKFLLKSDQDGSTTEISFHSKILMHVKKTPANVDLRPESQRCLPTLLDQRVVDTSQLGELLSEVNAGSRSLHKWDSTNLLKMAVHNNRSKSRNALLKLKSSQNFTNLDFQRKNSVHSVEKYESDVVREIMTPQAMMGCSNANIVMKSKSWLRNSQNNFVGDCRTIENKKELAAKAFTIEEICRLHGSQYPSTLLSRESQLFPSCQHIVTEAIVHREKEDM